MKTVWLLWALVVAVASGCSDDDQRRLVTIEVSLANSALYAPADTRATAVGVYSDGVEEDITSVVVWGSSNTSIGDVDVAGTVSALSAGRTDIGATLDNVYGKAELTVLEPKLESIDITGPSQLVPNGLFLQLAATGHYNNGTTRVITSAVTWSTDSSTIATIDSTGKLAGLGVGGTKVRATQGAITAELPISVTPGVLVTLAITPNPIPALPKGLTVDLHAMGTFSDGVENDVTDLVIWAATEPTVATVDAITTKGRVTSVATTGATNVVATFNASHGTFSDTVTVSAAPAVVVRVEIDPLTLTLPLGRADNLTCTAVYSDTTETDVTDAAAWASDDSAVATVSADGLVTANLTTTGTTKVACDYLTFSDEIDVIASAAVLDHVDVTPATTNVLIHGADVPFTAAGVLSNGAPTAVTCTWDALGVATISATGLLDADSVVAGPSTVTATCSGIAGTAMYTAYAATSIELVIDDAFGASPPIGSVLTHHARALTSGPMFDVTAFALWESLTAALTVSVTPGEFTAASAGPGTVRATFDGKIATRAVTVTP